MLARNGEDVDASVTDKRSGFNSIGRDRVRLHTKTYAAMGKHQAVSAIGKTQRVENGSTTSGDKANMEPVIRLLNEALATELSASSAASAITT